MPKYRFQIVELGCDPLDAGIVELPDAATALKRAKELACNLMVVVQGEDGLDGSRDCKGNGWNNFPDDSLIEKEDVRPLEEQPIEDRVAKYVDHGGTSCPYCGSDQVSSEQVDADGGSGTADVRCAVCGKEWKDIWSLVGIYTLDEQGCTVDEIIP